MSRIVTNRRPSVRRRPQRAGVARSSASRVISHERDVSVRASQQCAAIRRDAASSRRFTRVAGAPTHRPGATCRLRRTTLGVLDDRLRIELVALLGLSSGDTIKTVEPAMDGRTGCRPGTLLPSRDRRPGGSDAAPGREPGQHVLGDGHSTTLLAPPMSRWDAVGVGTPVARLQPCRPIGEGDGVLCPLREFRHAGWTFDVVDDGPRDADCMVLLHGFPSGARCWDGVVRALGGNFRTLALDQRGYSPGTTL